MKRCNPITPAQVNPSSTICAAVKCSPKTLAELVVHGVVVGGKQVEELDGHLFLRGERAVAGCGC
jgi:hypothetical protein